jgi:two-component system response regulator MprA
MRILLVEDNRLSAELFDDILSADGHEVVIEREGKAGLARARAERFDVILLDIDLPGLNGVEICRALRSGGDRTPILALSASAMPDQVSAGMEAGFNSYLTKPLSPDALRASIQALASVA